MHQGSNLFQHLHKSIPPNRRSSSVANACDSISSQTSAQLATTLGQTNPSVDSSCWAPIASFFKDSMCSSACISSPLLAGLTHTRRLLGGNSPTDPSSSCEDACFAPYVSGLIRVMKVLVKPECAALITPPSSNRRLLGGATSMDQDSLSKLELGFGMLCNKNSDGDYCMNKFQQLGDNSVNTDQYLSEESCVLSPDMRTTLETLGCCWGDVVTLSGLDSLNGADTKPDLNAFTQEAAKCGVTLKATPCTNSAGMSMAAVALSTSLGGVSKANFDAATQSAFKKGVSNMAKVSQYQVTITEFKPSSRRSGLDVTASVQLLGAQTAQQQQVATAVSDSAALQSSLQATGTGTNLAGVTVSSSTGTASYNVVGSADMADGSSGGGNSDSSVEGWEVAWIVLGMVLVLALVAAGISLLVSRQSTLQLQSEVSQQPQASAKPVSVDQQPQKPASTQPMDVIIIKA